MAYIEPKDVYTNEDLAALIESDGVIHTSITIRGEYLREIIGVGKIVGSLGSGDSKLESFGSLMEVGGDIWFSIHTVAPLIEDLGKLESVGGNLSLKDLKIKSLGNLRRVGGNLNLRNTPVEDLGNLEFVGGSISLPNIVRESIDLSRVKIGGRVSFHKEYDNRLDNILQNQPELTESEIPVPLWKKVYAFSVAVLDVADAEQKRFYDYFKQSFLTGKIVDVRANSNYVFALMFDLIKDFRSHRNQTLVVEQLTALENAYPVIQRYTEENLSAAIAEKPERRDPSLGIVLSTDFGEMFESLRQERPDLFKAEDYSKAVKHAGEQKKNIARRLPNVADSIRQIGEDLRRNEATDPPLVNIAAKYSDALANGVEQVSDYLENKDLREILRDAKAFARSNPAIFIGGAFVLGLLAARVLKNSAPSHEGRTISETSSEVSENFWNEVNAKESNLEDDFDEEFSDKNSDDDLEYSDANSKKFKFPPKNSVYTVTLTEKRAKNYECLETKIEINKKLTAVIKARVNSIRADVSADRLFVQTLYSKNEDSFCVFCLELSTGETLWKTGGITTPNGILFVDKERKRVEAGATDRGFAENYLVLLDYDGNVLGRNFRSGYEMRDAADRLFKDKDYEKAKELLINTLETPVSINTKINAAKKLARIGKLTGDIELLTQSTERAKRFEAEKITEMAKEAAKSARKVLSLSERLSERRDVCEDLPEEDADEISESSDYWNKRWKQIEEEGGS